MASNQRDARWSGSPFRTVARTGFRGRWNLAPIVADGGGFTKAGIFGADKFSPAPRPPTRRG